MSAPLGWVRGVGSGFALPFEGIRWLGRERSLWSLAAFPLAVSAVALGAVALALFAWAGELHGFVVGWMPQPRAELAWEWIWVGPALAGLWLLGKLLFAALAIVTLALAFLVGSLVAAPFHDALSRRVELLATGRVDEVEGEGLAAILREAGRALREELRRLVFFFGIWLAIAVAGFLLPGGPLLAAPAMTLVTVLFLPLDYASYTLDRRRLSFRQKCAWLSDNLRAGFGFGAAAFGFCAVPGLNLLAMPVLVVAGTLLALRHPTHPESPAGHTENATSS